jgi:RimJ/RimL family protein N-acetyltransferase
MAGVYLSHQNEIGIAIYKKHQSKGFGREALGLLIEKHGPAIFYDAPTNTRSEKLFNELGFKHLQNTYAPRTNAGPALAS